MTKREAKIKTLLAPSRALPFSGADLMTGSGRGWVVGWAHVLLAVALTLAASSGHAETQVEKASELAAKSCRNSAFLASDGCQGAPAYNAAAPGVSFLDPYVFSNNVVFQTPGMTRDGVAKIIWNAPGRDFAVGVAPGRYCDGPYISPGRPAKPCSTTPGLGESLIDARLYDWTADPAKICAGAQIKAYEDGSASVVCNVADGGLQIEGFDFTPTKSCVTFRVEEAAGATGQGAIRFANNRFVQPDAGHACNSRRYDPLGVLTTTPFFLHPNLAHKWDFVVENNWFDPRTSRTHAGQGAGMIDVASAGSATFRYNYLGDMPSRSVNAMICDRLDFEFNFTPSMGRWPNDAHGELFFATIDAYNSTTYCPTDETGVVHVQRLDVINNFAVSQHGLSGATFNAPLLINLSGRGTPAISIEKTRIELNILVANELRPHRHYVMWVGNPKILALDLSEIEGQYTTGDIVAVSNGCSEPPKLRLYAVSGSGRATQAQAEAWTGGDCDTPPRGEPFYATTCVTCAHAPSGLRVKIAGPYLNYNSGNGLIAFENTPGSGVETHLDLSLSHNALDALGTNGRKALVVNKGGNVLCAARLQAIGNFDLETGTEIPFPPSALAC